MAESLIIIPTYNEKKNIAKILRKIFYLPQDFHVLVVDDNSPDGTAEEVKYLLNEFSGKLFMEQRQGKLGLGTAYIYGFNWALKRDYQFIFEMDADFSHNPDDLPRLLNACKNEGADLSIGSRYIKGGKVMNWPANRILMSYFASVYVRLVTWMPVKDTTAGFVCYKRKLLETLAFEKIKFTGYAFQIEMKFATWKTGYRIKEIPITFTDRTEGDSKMSHGIFKEAVVGVLKMKINSFLENYRK